MKKFRKLKDVKSTGLRNEKFFDAPPADFSIQEIPRSLKEFMLLKESMKNSDNNRAKVKSRSSRTAQIRKNFSTSTTSEALPQETFSFQKKDVACDNELSSESSEDERPRNKIKLKQKKKLKLMKLKEKRKRKKLLSKLENEKDMNEFVKDNIKFGEVVHRPPQLSILPRKVAQSGFQNRPGRKDDLLLKSLLRRKHS